MSACNARTLDCGHHHHSSCFCDEDQGSGYTHEDEYGPCYFCDGTFDEGVMICHDQYNEPRICPCFINAVLTQKFKI